jgi:hypothetical protein
MKNPYVRYFLFSIPLVIAAHVIISMQIPALAGSMALIALAVLAAAIWEHLKLSS